MGYTVKNWDGRGHDIICETVADLHALLNQNGTARFQGASSAPTRTATTSNNSPMSISAFVAKLPQEQRDLLRTVATAPAPIPRDRLRELVGVTDTHQFAGVLISISKYAKNTGIDSPLESIYERENGNGPRTYQYRIRDDMSAALTEALAIETGHQ